MSGAPYKRYSVYDRRTDMPVVIFGTSRECMDALRVTAETFYTYVTRSNNGVRNRKYDIYVDELEEAEDGC